MLLSSRMRRKEEFRFLELTFSWILITPLSHPTSKELKGEMCFKSFFFQIKLYNSRKSLEISPRARP